MNRDFTIEIFKELLITLKNNGYMFFPFKDFSEQNENKFAILRHDVDKLPYNSLRFAEIQKELGITGTYYFRIVKESFNEKVIEKIASLGHEIGYHYEDLSIARGDFEKALSLFRKNLDVFKKYYDVKTICMHGSPISKWDNKKIWEKYSYKEFGIIGEPYFDLNFDEVFYITDTGRKWDGSKVSVRDKVNTKFSNVYRTTKQIIESINENSFPQKVMFTFHPQRWNDNLFKWSEEYILQKIKNVVKKVIVKKKNEL